MVEAPTEDEADEVCERLVASCGTQLADSRATDGTPREAGDR